MRPNRVIYEALTNAPDLEAAVRKLPDAELRNVRAALARGEFESWPADLLHGVCMAEGCERFMNADESNCDRCHGSEVPQ